MWQLQIDIGKTFPVSLVLLSHLGQGRVVFYKTAPMIAVVDLNVEGTPRAIFDGNGFSIGEEDFSYGIAYDYKNLPMMLEWLIAQNLQWPSEIVFEG